MDPEMLKPSKKRIPRSIIVLAVAIGVFALSAFPATGIFLMLVAAPFWSILLVNLAILLIFYDVFHDKFSKMLLAIPITYFGIYGALTISSHLGKEFTIESDNGLSLPISPVNVLGLKGRFNVNMEDFLQRYNLTTLVYVDQHTDKIENKSDAKQFCTDVGNDKCIDTMAPTAQPDILVRTSWDKLKDHGKLTYKLSDFEWTIVKGNVSRHVTGQIRTPLAWVPMPVAGCGLIDQPPAWKCKIGFLYEDDFSLFGGNSWNSALAQLTGIKPRP